MPSDDSLERKPAFSQAHSDDDVEVYERKVPRPEADPNAAKLGAMNGQAPPPTAAAAPAPTPRTAGPDAGPFRTFVQPTPAKNDGARRESKPAPTASAPVASNDEDSEIIVGRRPAPQERLASTAETGKFLIAPSQDDGTMLYPSKAKAPSAAPASAPAAAPHGFEGTVRAIADHAATTDRGEFLIPPGGGSSGDSFYEYPSKPKEKAAGLAASMVYRGPMSDDGTVEYPTKPKAVPAAGPARVRAAPTESSYDGTELYVGHKPTRSLAPTSEPYMIYGGRVEETKPGVKPGPPTTGPNATKYYANPNAAPGNKVVERTSSFDVYESEPRAAPPRRAPGPGATWEDGNAILYTSKDPGRRPDDKYPSLVNLGQKGDYARTMSDANGYVLYEKPAAAPTPRAAPARTGTTDVANSYVYYEKPKAAPAAAVPPAPAPAPAPSYELTEEPQRPFATPATADATQPPAPTLVEEPAVPAADVLVAEPVEGEDFEVFERATPHETVAEATLDVGEPAAPATAQEDVAFAPMLDLPLPAAEAVADVPVPVPDPVPVAEHREDVEATTATEFAALDPLALGTTGPEAPPAEEAALPVFDPLALELPTAPLAAPPEPEPATPPFVEDAEPVVLDIIETADVTRIEPEAANVEPGAEVGGLPTDGPLDGIDVLDAPPLEPIAPRELPPHVPGFPSFDTLPTWLPGFESAVGDTDLTRAMPTEGAPHKPESGYLPNLYTTDASGDGPVDMRIGFVVSEFNFDITNMMLERARTHAEFLGATIGPVLQVPGTFDMGLAVKKLLGRKDVDGVVTLGAVIQGETDHDQVVLQHASRKIADLSLEFGKPVSLGITGPGMTRLQAMERIDRAKDAVEAVVKLHQRLRSVEAA